MEKLADELQAADSEVTIARLDASKYSNLARRFGVRGFPTFKLFSAADGKVLDYTGGRTASAFSEWIAAADASTGADIPKGSAPSEANGDSASPAAGGSTGSRNVVALTDANFEHDTQAASGATTGTWFVAFVAPWCGHCKNLHPAWDGLADELKGVVNIARVDATENRATSSRFGVRAFPTLKLFHKGKVFEYSGDRSKDSLKEFALGGFKEGTGEDVPGVVGAGGGLAALLPSGLTASLGLDELAADISAIATKYRGAAVVLVATAFTTGLMVMLVIAVCTIPAPQTVAQQQQWQVPPPPPPLPERTVERESDRNGREASKKDD